MKATGEQVRDAMIAANITAVDHHECGICYYMCRFIRREEALFFDPGCDCTRGAPLELRSWQDAADWINMQNEEGSAKIAQAFGLTNPVQPEENQV